MTHSPHAIPGVPMPEITLEKLGGGTVSLTGAGWKAIVVYRGAHCPMCKMTLTALEELKQSYADAGVEIIAISADHTTRTQPLISETGFSSAVGVGLTVAQMQDLGLYISAPINAEEAPAPFAEPAVFVVNGDGLLHAVSKSNAPFARTDMATLLMGIKYVQSVAATPRKPFTA